MAVMAVSVLIMGACSDGDSRDIADVRNSFQATDTTHLFDGVYNGVWTIGQQVVDTAQLVIVGNVLKVRLPEDRLTEFWLPKSDQSPKIAAFFPPLSDEWDGTATELPEVVSLNRPAELPISSIGYTDTALYANIEGEMANVGEAMYYAGASYVTIVDGVTYFVELLSDEAGRTVYKMDTMGWTLAYQVTGFRITDVKTMAWSVKHLEHPFALYYNTKERIR